MKVWQKRYNAIPETLCFARHDLSVVLIRSGWSHRRNDIMVAVGEILQNIIRHGCSAGDKGTWFEISLKITSQRCLIHITDNASPSCPLTWQEKGHILRVKKRGGMGLPLISVLADKVRFRPTISGNQATIYIQEKSV